MRTPVDEILQRHQRQVHLDFHTSPLIPDVASEFDADTFAEAFAGAHVNSVTVFARCHHGLCYYPAQHGTAHPALGGRDLLGEQIEALHRKGIRAPIYTSVAWDEVMAARHPEWRQLKRDGSFAHWPGKPGEWKFLNFLDPAYQDFLEAHVREVIGRYGKEVDGLFFDIVFFHGDACWSEAGRRFREARGLMADDPATQARFHSAGTEAFARKFTEIVRGLTPPETTVFHNSIHPISTDTSVGARTAYPWMTHFEIESLPSGPWGYHHFPRVARAISHWGSPWLGMTGRFQRAWGDFGGIKPQAALEYECFRTQALGGANSVGDQLPPRGRLEPDIYTLIGNVYAQCAEAEDFYAGSVAAPQFASVCSYYPGRDSAESSQSDEGAMLMAADVHRDVAMVDERSDLRPYDLVQLPDSVVITPQLGERLRAYYADGGKLLLSGRSGFDAAGKWALDFLPLEFSEDGTARPVPKYPTYWRAREECADILGRADRVCYLPGVLVTAGAGTRVLVERVLPFFQRTDVTFCSHVQAPPMAEADASPAVVMGERFVYFADPIFREFRETGNLLMRDGWHDAMNRLGNRVCFGEGLPTTVHVFPRRRGDDLILTLLHYVPTRKAADRDMIEERSSFAGERLKFHRPEKVKTARLFGGAELERVEAGCYALPMAKGRLLVEVPGYFV